MKLLYLGPELTPFTCGGADGELLSELSLAAARAGHEVTVVSPYRDEVSPQRHGLARRLQTVDVSVAHQPRECVLFEGSLRSRGGEVLLLEQEAFAGGAHAAERKDDHQACFLLAQATLQLLEQRSTLPDVIHCVGWQTGFFPLLLARHPRLSGIPVLFSFSDPAQLGLFPASILEELGIGYDHFNPDGLEFHDEVSLLKAGLIFAEHVVVPSVALVEELATEAGGAGLHGLYSARGSKLSGITPGLAADIWNPKAGLHLAAGFDREDSSPKQQTKGELQARLGLRRRGSPLLLCAGPFDQADALEALLARGEELMARKLQIVFAGVADDDRRAALKRFAASHRERVAIVGETSFDDDLWHTMLGAADGLLLLRDSAERRLLLPRALRFGAIPIVPGAGPLAEVIADFDPVGKTGNGFRFAAGEVDSQLAALGRFARVFDPASPIAAVLRENAMQTDVGWSRPWALLETLYQSLLVA
jgi:starch synthase